MVLVNAPTNTASDEEQDEFYELLHQVMNAAPDNDMKIFFGDFNAQNVRDNEEWVNKA